jgi:hypothetical protein
MPLGRTSHAPLEANPSRRRNGESALLRHRPSNGRQEMPPAAQVPLGAVPRDLPSLPDRTYQDAPVGLAIQPNKAQADCTLCFFLCLCAKTLLAMSTCYR